MLRALDTNTTLVSLRIQYWTYPEDRNIFAQDTTRRIEEILEGREVPAVYDGPVVKATVAPMPTGLKRKPSGLHLLLL